MKKLMLPFLAVMTLGTASAQFNLGISAGYGIGSPGHLLGTDDQYNNTGNLTGSKAIYGTLGSGIQANLTPGYQFGEHFGAELGLNGFFGTSTTVEKSTSSSNSMTHTMKSNQFRITPAFIIRSGGEKISVYARTGLVIPLIGSVQSEIKDNPIPGSNRTLAYNTTGKVSLGYTGAFGVNIHFGKKFGLFAEAGATSLRVKSKETEMKKYDLDGQDLLGNVPTYNKQTKYVDELTTSSNNFSTNSSSSMSQAKEDIRQIANFSNFFIQVGFKMTFGD